MKVLALSLMLAACGSGEKASDAEAPDGLEDGDGTDDAGGLAPLTDPSSGECPDMTQSHTTTFTSSGEDRVVTIVVPDDPPEDMPLVFFFHGLLDPGSTPVPTEYMANALNLQGAANEAGVAFVLPQSGEMSRMGFSFYMWAVDEYEGADIVLFDDLRSCGAQQLSLDLNNVHAMGFSGGALFTTVVARDRGDALASIIELSGGADLDVLTFDDPLSAYDTPAYTMPALLVSGGDSDAWPGGGMELVNFSNATDALEDRLVDDGHFVVRCEHTLGHQVPMSAVDLGWEWIAAHSFDQPSPYESEGLVGSGWADWCEIAS